MVGDPSPSAVGDLYDLPLPEFTPARNELSKRLRGDGDKEGAAAVKALRKPSITAWALNQLARRRPDEVDALLEAAADLRAAHARALSGDGSMLRAATRAYQERVGELARLAVSILEEGGSAGANHAERLMESLWAPATDEEAGRRLREGRLTEELERTAFGLPEAPDPDGTDRPAPSAPPAAKEAPAKKAPAKKVIEATEKAAAERRAAELAAAEAEQRAAAEAQLAEARRAAAQRRTEADGAAERARQLAGEAARAEEVAAAARQASDEAERAAHTATVEAADADAAVAEAEERLGVLSP